MKKFILSVVLMVAVLYSAKDVFAVNTGFETGDTSGWVETYPLWDGRIDVVTGWTESSGAIHYRPVRGKYFAVLETGVPDGDYSALSQAFKLKGGDKLEGWAAFCCGSEVYYPYEGDNGSYNDYARINILNSHGVVVDAPWYADSYDIGYNVTIAEGVWNGETVSFGPLPWKHWSWTAPRQDRYTLQYLTTQGGDSAGNSYALFDGPTAAVPEAPGMILSVICFAGIMTMGVLRRAYSNTQRQAA